MDDTVLPNREFPNYLENFGIFSCFKSVLQSESCDRNLD